MYVYQYMKVSFLFNKYNKIFLDNFFLNIYRWMFFLWDKRVNVVVGLLEYGIIFFEIYNLKFYMCDYVEQCFGYIQQYEVSLVFFENIMLEYMIGNILEEKKCLKDLYC